MQPLALVEGVVHGALQSQAVRGVRVIAGELTCSASPLARDGRTHAVAGLTARRLFPLLRVVATASQPFLSCTRMQMTCSNTCLFSWCALGSCCACITRLVAPLPMCSSLPSGSCGK